MPAHVAHEFAGDAQSPAAARGFAKSALAELLSEPVPPTLRDDVELVVSELVTNAVRAGSPTVTVQVSIEDAAILLRVADEARGWPEERHAGIHDTSGRGLPLVSALSSSWGVRIVEHGKVVWATLALPA
ncbi:MAG TPA: ATP-binding protein [Jatrophihabitans sp.]|uniref:ATP-binding protein n=1 Tax=Jatrophihabitans sp. TaxID=1932789 RepID=UPI002E008423|nr:ATP-binding protein [Jatrophihabitans sp.]